MNHENTRLYQKTVELSDLAQIVIDGLPPGLGFLADQLRRATSSITLNFAEGCKKHSKKERARYFLTADGSAREVSAILDVAASFRGIDAELRNRGKDMCDHICAMLYKFG